MFTIKKKIVLVRHGKTDWNTSARFQGHTDIPLNDYGIEQAKKTALRLKNWDAQLIVTSPLSRAMDTAKAIAGEQKCALTPVPMSGLSEVYFGDWEGARVADIEKQDKPALDAWHRDGFFCIPNGAETWDNIYSRVHKVTEHCVNTPEERIIVVAHGGILRAVMVDLVKIDPHIAWHLSLYNCSVSGIEICTGMNNLVFLNDVLHLDDDVDPSTLPFSFR